MSLHKVRGTSMVEYALVLFVFLGGAAAAVKGTGGAVRDAFAASAHAVGAPAASGASGESGDEVGLRVPLDGRRDGGR